MHDLHALGMFLAPRAPSKATGLRAIAPRSSRFRAIALALFGAGALAASLFTPSSAEAQTPMCDRYRAELNSLGRGGDPRAAGEANRIRSELGRLQNYRAQLGCDRGFLIFNDRPPQCGQIDANIRALQGAYANAAAAANGNDGRRRQLMAAIAQNCGPGAGQAREPNFLERLFGAQPQQQQQAPLQQEQYDLNPHQQATEGGGRFGGSRVVCVRACDGYFFPLPSNRREGAEEMCQAQCPATQTLVYFMSGDGAIERAGNREGKPYTELPNAGKYKRSFDAACYCKKPDESWATALAPAENLVKSGRGDMIVSEQKAEEMSRPRVSASKPEAKKPVAVVAPDAEDDAAVDPSTLPTASNESSGIGPQTIDEEARTVGAREGQVRDTVGTGGERARVRVVAPNIFAAPTEPTPRR